MIGESMENSHSNSTQTLLLEELLNAGREEIQSGEFEQAAKSLALVSQKAERAGDRKTQSLALLLLGQVQRQQSKLADARDCLNQAMQLRVDSFGKDSAEVAEILDELGCIDCDEGCFEEGERKLNCALEIRQSIKPTIELDLTKAFQTWDWCGLESDN